MKDNPNKDYTRMTQIALMCGLVPYVNRWGKTQEGVYTLKGLDAPIDLSACKEDEKSVLRTALQQLSERVDDSNNDTIERDLAE